MFRNMTPHLINVVSADGTPVVTIKPDGGTVRLASVSTPTGNHEGVPLVTQKFGEPVGLPEYVEGTWLVVSALVLSALPERKDLCVPADLVRDANGAIIGCRALQVR